MRKESATLRKCCSRLSALGMDSNAVFHRSKLILKIYRDVVWVLSERAEELHEDDADYEAALGLLAGETEDEVILEQRIFDICLLDENGNEVQPVKEVRVTFSQVLNGEEKGVQIHHLDTEENVAESIDTFVDGEDVIMETGHFSYYSMTLAGSGVATIDDKSYDTLTNAVKAVKSGKPLFCRKMLRKI